MTDEQKSKQDLLRALITQPSTYTVEVIDNSKLPKNLKNKKEISFEVRPPVINTMTKAAMVLNSIPANISDPKTPPAETAKYSDKLCEVFAIYSHGNSNKEMPEWYVPFLMSNLQPREMIQLVQEVSLKTRTDFFLPSFQIASVMNPMMMMIPEKEIEKMEK